MTPRRLPHMIRTTIGALALTVLAPLTAQASPGVDFVCFSPGIVASGGLDLEETTAYITVNGQEHELPIVGEPGGSFATYEKGPFRLAFGAPEGDLTVAGNRARCFQTAESIKARALYGKEGYRWDSYDAPGKAFQTVRSSPSVLGERLTSFDSQTDVLITANTDQFMDGFYWYRIVYGDGNQGYIWGALLCTNAEHPELQSTLRRCN